MHEYDITGINIMKRVDFRAKLIFYPEATCIFDPQACISPCPFGYRKNKRGCDVSCACASEGNFQGDVHFDEDSLPELSEVLKQIILLHP